MKNSRHVGAVVLFAALVLVFAAGTALAQDPVKVAPNNLKVLLENDRVRVLDYHAKPGDKIPLHSHPAYIVYAISGSGKTRFTSADGKTSEMAGTVGAATWRDAETHAAEYLGPGDIHALLVELKVKPQKAAPKKGK
ncbi:MAG: cytoplasmic protein [Acidobacteria bacterium]|nr:cytoplasmic protein [Acidobacteriota bacterium]